MLFEKELIDFINVQKPSQSINEIIEGLELLKQGLKDFKKELSESLPIFFMSSDRKSIERCLKYGEQADNAINYINSINIKAKNSSSADMVKEKIMEPIKSDSQNKTEPIKSIKLIVIKNNICPYCKNKLSDSKTSYTTFKDIDKHKSIHL